MKKILLLDIRLPRQNEALSNVGIDLKEFNEVNGLKNLSGNECETCLNHLDVNKTDDLQEFELFVFHESDLSSVALKNITDFCLQTGKSLILFSGSIQQNLYFNDGFNMLSVNSKSLYSDKIIEFFTRFIANEVSHLTELIYGNSWELNYALIYRQLLLDEINGDKINHDKLDDGEEVDSKRKSDLLKSCISILGEYDKNSLDMLIDKKINLF